MPLISNISSQEETGHVKERTFCVLKNDVTKINNSYWASLRIKPKIGDRSQCCTYGHFRTCSVQRYS